MEDGRPKIQVIIAEDHLLFRETMRRLLWGIPDIEVIDEAEYGGDALRLVLEKSPDVLLLDLELPGSMDGIAIARYLHKSGSQVKVLVVSAHSEPHYIESVLGEGVAGYILKDDISDNIVEAIRGVVKGERGWFSQGIAPLP